MFGKELMNAKQIVTKLGISQGQLYKLVSYGMPYHQLGEHSRKYYVLEEVEAWLREAGYKQHSKWSA